VWEREDVKLLKELVESNADQEVIMRAFPEDRWGTIQGVMATSSTTDAGRDLLRQEKVHP
jgi:hypothetical protein